MLAILKGSPCRSQDYKITRTRLGKWCMAVGKPEAFSKMLYFEPESVVALYNVESDEAIKLAVYASRVYSERRDRQKLLSIYPTVMCYDEYFDVGNGIYSCETRTTVSIATDNVAFTMVFSEYIPEDKSLPGERQEESALIPV